MEGQLSEFRNTYFCVLLLILKSSSDLRSYNANLSTVVWRMEKQLAEGHSLPAEELQIEFQRQAGMD